MSDVDEPTALRALTFDVFGTVVDWRTSIIEHCRSFGDRHGIDTDWEAFADAWRSLYQPSMEVVRAGRRPWVSLDVLHRESLATLAREFGFHDVVGAGDLDRLSGSWHRLRPWPDSAPGLHRLKGHHLLVTLSNGNLSLMADLAAFAGLPWDALLGAEPTGHYKPMPEAYLGTARRLGCAPSECMMVAAHNDDLRAAAALGFRTAFVRRPVEHGPGQRVDLTAEEDWDLVVDGFDELAGRLGL